MRALVDGVTVAGSVEVVKMMAGPDAVEVRNSDIGGKLSIVDSVAGEIAVLGNEVRGGLSVQKNVADVAGLAVDANQVTGDLEVKDNNVPSELAKASVSMNAAGKSVIIDNNLIDTAPPFDMNANQVADSMLVTKNRGSTIKTVIGNVVVKKLACFDNDDIFGTFVGGPNVASQTEGQCF